MVQEENDKLKTAIRGHLKEQAEDVLKECKVEADESLITSDPNSATKILDDPDYTLVKALQTAQQNFVITDPSLPDNPIVYASGGFLSLTGYSMEQILGRNCRFLQGPDTDPDAVDKIRRAIEEGEGGEDHCCCWLGLVFMRGETDGSRACLCTCRCGWFRVPAELPRGRHDLLEPVLHRGAPGGGWQHCQLCWCAVQGAFIATTTTVVGATVDNGAYLCCDGCD